MLKLLLTLSVFISTHVFAYEIRHLDILKNQFEGCYTGTDKMNNKVHGRISYLPELHDSYLSFSIKGKGVDSLVLSFQKPDYDLSIVAQIFEEGTFINSSVLNRQITYQFVGEVERPFIGMKSLNETIVVFKEERGKVQLEIYQNDNREFLPDYYIGRPKVNYQTFTLKKVDC